MHLFRLAQYGLLHAQLTSGGARRPVFAGQSNMTDDPDNAALFSGAFFSGRKQQCFYQTWGSTP